MQSLTPKAQTIVTDLSQRYGFSVDAVTHMLYAVLNGNGSMAQFSHPEFAGSGQWMRGGMLMLGDMFNYGLKNNVDGLCNELSNLLANEPGLLSSGSFQSQSQGSGNQYQGSGMPMGENSLFVPDPSAKWWPQDLGQPSATGSQNNVKYAYFAGAHRLAVDTGGDVWVYDTQDHQIGGFSQQQGSTGGITFSSQFGTVNLSTLPVVSINGQAPQTSQTGNHPAAGATNAPEPAASNSAAQQDVFAALEKLGSLRDMGILTDEEFGQKKAELLSRV